MKRRTFRPVYKRRMAQRFLAAANKSDFARKVGISRTVLKAWADKVEIAEVRRRSPAPARPTPPRPPPDTDATAAWKGELEALIAIVDALKPLPHDVRQRVVLWAYERFSL